MVVHRGTERLIPGPGLRLARQDTAAALLTGDREVVLELADEFDFWNNTLCPLDSEGNHE